MEDKCDRRTQSCGVRQTVSGNTVGKGDGPGMVSPGLVGEDSTQIFSIGVSPGGPGVVVEGNNKWCRGYTN